ncbi:MAG TPA: amidohydrolase family protein [Verrucomicrobiota bacterium]|nr:amidohydrolase family protein [Verrucomicrobiota bacterium]
MTTRVRRLRRWGIGAGLAFVGLAGLLLAWLAVLFRGPALAPQPVPGGLVDLHCHTAGLGHGGSGCFVSPELAANFRFGIYLQAFGVTREELQQHGDQLVVDRLAARLAESGGVARAVVLALDGPVTDAGELATNRTEVHVPNEFLAAAVARHTNLLWGASINPLRHDALARLDWAATHGAVLVKWLPAIMDFDPGDPRLRPFYERLAALRMPLLCHTGAENSFTRADHRFGDPLRLRLALECGVTVIAAHVAGGSQTDGEEDFLRLRRLMEEFPNLYADTSALTQVNRPGHLRRVLADPLVRERLVYGSDFPLSNTALVSPWYFPRDLSPAEMARLDDVKNPWDRDVALKAALGMPPETFTRGARLLRLPAGIPAESLAKLSPP